MDAKLTKCDIVSKVATLSAIQKVLLPTKRVRYIEKKLIY